MPTKISPQLLRHNLTELTYGIAILPNVTQWPLKCIQKLAT
ncbi:hypothetical protein DSUL_20102 [Desulfovibrionales bacterium]